MRADNALLISVLSDAFNLVINVLQNGSDGGRIDGKSYNEYFTIDSLKKNYGEKPLEMARMIVLDCIKGERFGGTEDFDEFMKELEKRLAPRMMNAEDFVLLPSE